MRISLRTRIYSILTALVFITLLGGVIMMWYTYSIQNLLSDLIDRYLEAFQTSEQLETALANQKGFVSYYFLDGNPEWLRKLGENRQIFKERLEKARSLAESKRQKEAIESLEWEYTLYVTSKDRVIEHYKAGEKEAGARLHAEVRSHFARILEMCEHYKHFYQEKIRKVRANSRAQAMKLRIIAGSAILTVLILALLMLMVLLQGILTPLKSLAVELYCKGDRYENDDEVIALSRSVHDLIEDADYTRFELEKSRETLLQSEKMALVGRLAAGMAHSIRNPLTSVKMRLFSLSRSLDLSDTQQEDFDVISEEIRHTDTIVENFLEFSRPPKLKIQRVSPSEVVNLAIQLLEYRLMAYDVDVRIRRLEMLPKIEIDPEQLKEVLVNIVVNACEAMGAGGSITITEEMTETGSGEKSAEIRITDSGPGISEAHREKVLQPFFTTKEEGTGLGLSIAVRIVEQHGGTLSVLSEEGDGATFTINLPIKEKAFEHNPHN